MKLEQEDVFRIVMNVEKHNQKTSYIAEKYDITPRRVQQLVAEFRQTGEVPILRKRGRKPSSHYPENIDTLVCSTAAKYHCGSTVTARYLRKVRGIKIGNNAVCEIMKKHGISNDDLRKRVKKKPWVRYERSHPLSAVHIDWHENVKKQKVCAISDDCSRMLLAIGEYPRISTEESINLMQSVIDRYSYIRDIGQVISDHGSEFVANKRDKHGNAKHRFELYCEEKGIKQVLCRVKHPQTNGKLEKFFHIYDERRWEFDSIEDFQHWYNYIRPHMSLDFNNLETPYQAFNDRLQDVFVGNYMEMIHAMGIQNRGEENEVLS